MARDDLYWRDIHGWLREFPPAWPWETPPAPTPLADVAAVRDAAAEHGRPFGPTPPAEGDTPC